jgi:hypothetical protein
MDCSSIANVVLHNISRNWFISSQNRFDETFNTFINTVDVARSMSDFLMDADFFPFSWEEISSIQVAAVLMRL